MNTKEIWEVRVMVALAAFVIVGGLFALIRYNDYVSAFEQAAARGAIGDTALAKTLDRPGAQSFVLTRPKVLTLADPEAGEENAAGAPVSEAQRQEAQPGPLESKTPIRTTPPNGDPRPNWSKIEQNSDQGEQRGFMRLIRLP